MKKLLAATLALLALGFSAFALEKNIADNEKVEKVAGISSVENTKGTKLYVVGDSTLSSFADPYFYPRYGYGTKLQDYLNAKKIQVINLAMSGRSSKSFTTEVNYQTLCKNIKKGDYLIIGFGHNDEKAEEDRYTDPTGSKETEGSFKNSLYVNYVKLAQDKGATPILCTPIVRRSEERKYTGSMIHQTADSNGFKGGDYSKAVIELAKETGVACVDLTSITKARYESMTAEETSKFHAWQTFKPNSVDNTHLNTYGASVVAYDVINEVAKQNKKFAKLVNKNAPAPTIALLVQNPDYVMPTYEGFSPKDKSYFFKKVPEPWFGTAFGDCGGDSKITTPSFNGIVPTDNGFVMNSGSADGSLVSGKISGSIDGMCVCFQQIPHDKDFTLTATANVKYLKADNQASFGLIVRDDIYICKNDKSINSDYVAVGALDTTKDGWTSAFQRLDTKLNKIANASEKKPAAGTKVVLSITKTGNSYSVKYGKNPAQTIKADLNAVDADYVYAGLFTARCATVEFTDVKLEVK